MSDDVLATIHGSDSDGGISNEEELSDEVGGEYPDWDEEACDTHSIQTILVGAAASATGILVMPTELWRCAGTSGSMLRSCGSMLRNCAVRMRQLLWLVFHRVSQSRPRASVAAARARQSCQGFVTAARPRPSWLLSRTIAGSVPATPLAVLAVRELRNAPARHSPLSLWFRAAAAAAAAPAAASASASAAPARRTDSRQRVDYFQRRCHHFLLHFTHRRQHRGQHGLSGTQRLHLCQLQRERHQEC